MNSLLGRRGRAVISRMVFASLLFASSISCGAENLAARIKPLIDDHRGEVSVAIKPLGDGRAFEHRADEPMPTASLIKFPLMIATYDAVAAGKVDLDKMITLRDEDKVPGSGVLTPHFSPGATLSLRDAIRLMIVYSDNTATNLVIDQVGLPATAQLMESLGCPDTKLHSKTFRRETSIFPKRSQQFGLGSTTAADMVKLLELLHRKQLVSSEACDKMRAHMLECEDRRKLARLLPPDTKIAHKGGAVAASRCDAGLIESPGGPIAICVLTTDNDDQRWADDNAAQVLIGEIARQAYDFFSPVNGKATPTGPQVLEVGATGRLVEALQRTLNARMKPSPGLAIDGDFGPNTKATVVRFQKSNELDGSGVVDAKTWQALGTLVTKGPAVPDPETINAAVIEKRRADSLTGPPHVTCKAWAIGDAATGELLWGMNEHQPLDIASTTKMMTAYVVTTLAGKEPAVLDEIVTFSNRADETIGSTAGVRAGEKVSVGELLYGLLLPSGNDASVAFAEHFGARLGNGDGEDPQAYDQFIAAMNRMANQLGMKNSSFANTAGFTDADHKSTARDLLTLAWHAMKQPLFRKCVGTVQRGCTVEGPGGYRRNLLWKNTNRLLRTEGYDGVKTGTTSAAGSCLVSRGQRGERSLIMVVLGAKSTDARYVDSRNLYRWAWRELGVEEPP